MTILSCAALFGVSCSSCKADGQDSLQRALRKAKKNTPEYCLTLLDLAYSYQRVDTTKSLSYLQKAKATALLLDDTILMANCEMAYVDVYLVIGQLETAQRANRTAIALLESTDSTILMVDALHTLAWIEYELGHYQEMLATALKMDTLTFQITDTTDRKHMLPLLYNTLGASYGGVGEYRKSVSYYTKSLKLDQELEHGKQSSTILNNISVAYSDLGLMDSAELFARRCILIDSTSMSLFDLGYSLHSLGEILFQAGKYEEAILYLKHALKAREVTNHVVGKADCHHQIGKLYTKTKLYGYARKELTKALEIALTVGDDYLITAINISILELDIKVSQPKSIAQRADQIAQGLSKRWFPSLYSEFKTIMGRYHLSNGDLNTAIQCFESVKHLQDTLGNRQYQASSMVGIAKVQYIRGNTEQALSHALYAYDRGQALHSDEIIGNSAEILYHIYKEQGELKKALAFHELIEEINRRKNRDENQVQTASYHFSGELLAKENEIKLLEIASRKQEEANQLYRTWLVVVFTMLIGFAILIIKIYKAKYKNDQLNRQLSEKSQNLEQLSQIQKKVFSIIAHDLRAPLNSLSGIFLLFDNQSLDPKELATLVNQTKSKVMTLGHTLDNLLAWAKPQIEGQSLETQAPEKTNASRVIEEQTSLYADQVEKKKLVVSLALDQEITLNVPHAEFAMIIRNLFSNAIKYSWEKGHIRISLDQTAGHAVMKVSDNGIGIKSEIIDKILTKEYLSSSPGTEEEKGTGIGLKATQDAVERNHGEIWIASTHEKGTTFYVKLPLI